MDLFGTQHEDDNEEIPLEECNTRTVEKKHTLDFERVTQTFQFVRGETQTITWDEWDGPITYRTGRIEEERGPFMVEQFNKIIGYSSIGSSNGEKIIKPKIEQVGEVTTANVAFRKEEQRIPMVLEIIAQHTQYIHPKTNEVIKTSKWPTESPEDSNISTKEKENSTDKSPDNIEYL